MSDLGFTRGQYFQRFDPSLSPSVYWSPCGSFAAPTDSAIWKVVTSPSRLSYRPPGSVLESSCGSLS